MRKAMDNLRNNRNHLKGKVADAVLFGMVNNNKRNLKKYLDILRNFNRNAKGEDDKKNAKRNALLKKFLFGNDMKKGIAFNKLRENRYKDIIKDLKE